MGTMLFLALHTGIANSAFGWYALFADTDGSFNTAVGAGALDLNNGTENTAVGVAALLLNTTGSDNNAVGSTALEFNTSLEPSTTPMGAAALSANVDGSENNAFGDLALTSNTTGGTNTGIGDDALFSVTTGNSNTALGDEAGSNLVDGEGNIYIGAQVQAGNTDELQFIRIGNDTAFAFPYDTFIAGIFDRAVDAGHRPVVFVDDTGKLGTITRRRRWKQGGYASSHAQRIPQSTKEDRGIGSHSRAATKRHGSVDGPAQGAGHANPKSERAA